MCLCPTSKVLVNGTNTAMSFQAVEHHLLLKVHIFYLQGSLLTTVSNLSEHCSWWVRLRFQIQEKKVMWVRSVKVQIKDTKKKRKEKENINNISDKQKGDHISVVSNEEAVSEQIVLGENNNNKNLGEW